MCDRDVLTALRNECAARMCDAGWTAQAPGFAAQGLAGSAIPSGYDSEPTELKQSLRGQFRAIALFECELVGDALSVSAGIVIEYVPAVELLTRLTGSAVRGTAPVEAYTQMSIVSIGEVSEAADRLCAGMTDTQVLEQLADVDLMVHMLQSRRAIPFDGDLADVQDMDPLHWEHAVGQLVPALLAGAGRFDDASHALDEYQRPASAESWSPREYRRVVRQLRRVINSGGELVLPSTPPFWPPATTTGRTLAPSVAQVLRKSLHQAVRAARRAVAGAALSAADSGVRRETPMTASRRVSAKIELEPPDRAAYPILGTSAGRVTVRVRPAARATLEQVARQATATGLGMCRVTVWFAYQRSRLLAGSSGLDVHIGYECVGELDAEIAGRLRGAMEAATERDEDVWADGYLTASAGRMPLRLEVAVPTSA